MSWQDDLIRHAADAEDKTVDEFTRDAAIRHAHEVLVDRRLFVLDGAAWGEFLTTLVGPSTPKPRLVELFRDDEWHWE